MDEAALDRAIRYAGGSGYIIRSGRVIKAWGSPSTLYTLRSTTKSVASIAFALALADGRLSLHDSAIQKHPSFGIPPNTNLDTGWLPGITLKHLATHTSGFDTPADDGALLFQYGTHWHYSDSATNWLAEITTLAFGQDLNTVLFDRIFTPIGIDPTDLLWRSNQFRADTINGIKNREFASGMSANVNAMARIGYLFLREGDWNGQQLIPRSYITMARTAQSGVAGLPVHDPDTNFNASNHYGLLWWNNADGTLAQAPRDTYWSWGLDESLIVIYPSLDMVAVRAGDRLQPDWIPDYAVISPFIEPIATSVTGSSPVPTAIDIYAAPVGTPIMELRINDQPVQSFTVSGGSHTARHFVKYSYTSPDTIPIDQIKVAFVNDNASNDLYVDKIVVNGISYESEASNTFSTGVYTSGRCQFGGGYFRSERLACVGYFQYGHGGSTIDIYAAPNGAPMMELHIDDRVVAAFEVIGGDASAREFGKYTYASQSAVAIEQIKIAFVNDSALNDLFIDKIVVDGVVYETEAPTTYSTGVYTAGQCQTNGGFFQQERLGCNGYFRYAQNIDAYRAQASVNRLPLATDDSATTSENVPVVIDLLANDINPNGDLLTIVDLSPAINGMVLNNGGGSITYTPNPGFNGVDSFSYTISDQNGGMVTASVTIVVSPTSAQAMPIGLRSPPDGAVLIDRMPILRWPPAVPSTCHHIQIDTTPAFSAPIQRATIVAATQYQTAPLAEGSYYWRVQVGGACTEIDSGPWSAVWSFTIE